MNSDNVGIKYDAEGITYDYYIKDFWKLMRIVITRIIILKS